jgi:uracil-DNA glycosylase
MTWDDLAYWRSGEWQVVEERLDDLDKEGRLYNPERQLLFAALDMVPLDKAKVVILGQDPYPSGKYSTGLAFSIPKAATSHPPTLVTLLKEYVDDLHYAYPKNGNLEKWASQGVLLWNAIPSCEVGKSLSHDWVEWAHLTKEIISTLSEKQNMVFVLLGGVARRYASLVDTTTNDLIETGHPSPRGNLSSKVPFTGSRIYSRINACLARRWAGEKNIDWRLDTLTNVPNGMKLIPPWEGEDAFRKKQNRSDNSQPL